MSTYRLLQDHYVGTQFLQAGTTQSTIDVGGVLPLNWIPTPNVDPLDTAAVNAFYAAGPGQMGLVTSRVLFFPVNPPVTYWIRPYRYPWSSEFSREFGGTGSPNQWFLTGLGVGKAPINL